MTHWLSRQLCAAAIVLGPSGLVVPGCGSSLPSYAAPSAELVPAENLDTSDVITYRALTRADFRGASAPAEVRGHEHKLGALTCGQVRSAPSTKIQILWQEGGQAPTRYWVKVSGLSFVALMDRKCSWWNDRASAFDPAYVLEHEQIHFAIFELGARRLNQIARQIAARMQIAASSQAEAEAHAQRVLSDALREENERLLSDSKAFDHDTSLGYRPDRQRAWWRKVTAELERTRAWASPRY
jgi:hypothetical protein